MIRIGAGERVVIATHNRGKVAEIKALLDPFGIQGIGAAALDLPEPEEIGQSFAENAAIKAEAATRQSGLPAISDDSGLCVAALGGAPGIYSARWAGPDKDFRVGMARIEKELSERGEHDLRAHFVCALAIAGPGRETGIFEGRVFGTLTFPPRGDRGFGYDPIFVPEGFRQTFGEMETARKDAISHRAKAFAKLAAAVFGPAR